MATRINGRRDPQADRLLSLVRSYQDGNTSVFADIYELLVADIYRYIYFRVSTKEQAEDLCQSVFTRIYEKIHTFTGVYFKAWVYTIAKHMIIDHYRKETIHHSIDEVMPPSVDDNQDAVLTAVTVRTYLSELPDRYREILLLRYIEDVSIADTAKILGMSTANVRVLSHRALTKLRELMQS